MADFKTLACVGLNGFEQARVRLLLEEASLQLQVPWRIGSPDNADLLLLAEGAPEAEAAALTARGRGIHCVYMRADAEAGIDILPTGFDVEDLVLILSSAFGDVSNFHSIDASMPEFFESTDEQSQAPDTKFGDIGGETGSVDALPMGGVPEAVDLEQYLRRDSYEYTLDYIVPIKLSEQTRVEAPQEGHASSRAQFRGNVRNPYAGVANAEAPAELRVSPPPARTVPSGARPLEAFTQGDFLVAPCRLELDDAHPLVLDPKHRQFMIIGGLAAAEPYAIEPFCESDFQRLTTRDLERWRAQCEPQGLIRLQWLLALRRGEGWLPRHLDPGGAYRVRRQMELDEHFDAQIRISGVLDDWRRLHEIAALAGVDMQAVFHAVTAYDAIGWLETRPRERKR